jgi:bacterial/archaeal transporter family protein
MAQSYVLWALIGMAGYSFTTLFVKLAERAGMPSFAVLAVATVMVAIFVLAITFARDEVAPLVAQFGGRGMLFALAAGITLTIAVSSLFHALSLGPATVVVPLYGMFIVGGAVLGVLVLHEPLTWQKVAGLAAAAAGVYLIAS